MIVLLDNYDSFTYNLYQILAQYEEVKIFRNDKITLKEIEKINPKGIIISPGPGRPENAGILIDMVKRFKGIYPMLGVCLAETDDKEIMGIKHKDYEIYGVQFHPESIYTSCGKKIIENFLKDVC